MNAFLALSALFAVANAGYLGVPLAYNGYYSAAPLGHDGRVIDTPEVAHAKAAHFAEYAKAAAAGGVGYAAGYTPAAGYAYGAAPLGHDGAVIDTPEVAHAKAAHFAEYAKAAAAAAAADHVASADYTGHAHGAAPLGHDGRVIETPEVAHAKAAHLAEHAKAAAAAHVYSAPTYSPWAIAPVAYSGYGYGHAAPLGHDGQVIETPEVAHAKAAHLAAHAAATAQVAHW